MDIMSESVTAHIYTISILVIIMIFNLFAVLRIKDYIKLAKLLRFMTPLYHMVNAMIIYTGAIVAAYTHDISPTVILMIAGAIFVMVIEIKRYKKMRVIKSTDVTLQAEFQIYAKKIYMIEISVMVLVYVISKIF